MKTFRWKFWRFAWMTHANWGWTTTVIDGSGRWVKLFGCLCFLAEPRDMLSSLEVAPGACGCTDLCKERGLASDEVSKSCHAVYGGVTP